MSDSHCIAGKIHISEETKAALDETGDAGFDVELRGEIEVKVRLCKTKIHFTESAFEYLEYKSLFCHAHETRT